ncbi:hypothetical protein [Rhizobium sp. 9140]|uniref:hypothetical protein n=1 Tax=Rhizobium sp. 9140 TaxID=1761900 RepID=UPI0007988B96|nr:hypothetical protein [Rhizobium sp. 9140]CZT35015.1 hypothetical protein GA0004734_00020270 [Rhizobium sp. 9140]
MSMNENGSGAPLVPDNKVRRAPRRGLHPLHEAAMRIAELGAKPRSKTKDLVGMLLTHGARAWRSTQPDVSIHLHVTAPSSRRPVRLRIK